MSPRGGQPGMSLGVPPFTRGVKWLAIATVLTSVLFAVAGESGGGLFRQLLFVPDELWHGKVWQLATYTFINPDPIGLLFAVLGLWMLGASLETRWGTRRFLTFYFLCGASGALATAVVGLAAPAVAHHPYYGNWSALEGLIAAFAVLLPDARIFLYFFPVQARLMLPISAGITLLFMLMTGWVPYLPQLFGLGAGVLFAGGVSPENMLLRLRVWWIDRRLRRSKLRVVRGAAEEEDVRSASRGSDKYLH